MLNKIIHLFKKIFLNTGKPARQLSEDEKKLVEMAGENNMSEVRRLLDKGVDPKAPNHGAWKEEDSPNGKHVARLIYKDEIRFGPSYHRLEIDGKIIPRRIFSETICWSDDSIYLAIEEWLTTNYEKGPITRVLLFDLKNQKVSPFKKINKGFATNFNFKDDLFVYQKKNSLEKVAVTVKIPDIRNWKNIKSWKIWGN